MPGLAWEPVIELQLEDYVQAIAWSSCANWLAVAEITGAIHCIEIASSKRQTWSGHQLGCNGLSWHPSKPLLASAGQDGTVKLWEPNEAQPKANLTLNNKWVAKVAWHPKGRLLAAIAGKQVQWFNEQGELLWTNDPYPSTLSDLAFVPHEEEVATVGFGGVQFWSNSKKPVDRTFEWKGSSLSIAISPNKKFIATGDQDCTIHFWRTRKPTSQNSAMMSGFAIKALELSWDSTSRYLASGGSSDVCLWDCSGAGPEGREPLTIQGNPEAYLRALAFSPKRLLLLTGDELGVVTLWDPSKRMQVCCYQLDEEISQLSWSPDDRRVAVGTSQGELLVLKLAV